MRQGSWQAWHETATLVQGEPQRPARERIINGSLCCCATSFMVMIVHRWRSGSVHEGLYNLQQHKNIMAKEKHYRVLVGRHLIL